MSVILLSKDDCSYVKSFWDDSISKGGSKYGSFELQSGNNIRFRTKVQGNYIDFHQGHSLFNFILKKVQVLGIKSISSGIKLARYGKGDYFEPHHDFNFYGEGALYKTLVIQLSDNLDYKGGDLLVKQVPQMREVGSYSLFLSSDIHEVTLITEGERWSMSIFLLEKDFVNVKHTI